MTRSECPDGESPAFCVTPDTKECFDTELFRVYRDAAQRWTGSIVYMSG
ncbi:hypothetical protein [Nonomuraea helvata]|uniref:Uncharacterized protein n=1 Tax=Nonomuraea helvata TaxID=37484 RepID=A0ABV5S544_9ACTN